MWNIFKSKKRREEERLIAEKRVAQIKIEVELVNEKVDKITRERYNTEKERSRVSNTICPICSSKNVNDRIKRQQGELKGDFHGEGWSALTFGSSSSHGKIRGKMDTNEVNKCNDCEHEWKKRDATFTSNKEVINSELRQVTYLLGEYYKADNFKFNALDIEEKYSSHAEKKSALLNEAKKGTWARSVQNFWSGISLETLDYIARKNLSPYDVRDFEKYYDEKILLSHGFTQLKTK